VWLPACHAGTSNGQTGSNPVGTANDIIDMIQRNLYFKDGVLFANGYERIVHGGRGDYIELTLDQIQISMKSHFNQPVPKVLSNEDFYYYWLEPVGREEKIYWQCNYVGYADYKRNFYYISPELLIPFDNKELF